MTAITSPALDLVLGKLRDHGSNVIHNGPGKAQAQCPAHDDNHASLSVTAIEGRVLIHCHAGCPPAAVVAAVDLGMADLFDNRRGRDYQYPGGLVVSRYYRRDSSAKQFAQKGNKADTSLYGSEHIRPDTKVIFVVEGEQDVDAARSIGLVAVSAKGGAGKAAKSDWSCCHGYPILIVADKDDPGQNHAAEVAAIVGPHVPTVKIFEPAEGCKDLADHIAAGRSLDELADYTPPNNSATAQPRRPQPMPELARLPSILDAVADEVRSRGLVGEERLAKTLYLVLTSRLLDKQVSAGVKGHSASGKSYTVETVTRFFPPEAYLEFTAMSERALVYSAEQYAHRTIVIYEVTALREGVEDDMTSYFVRSLLSEGRIDYEVTVRDKEGGFTTKKIVKKGPTNLVFTTTKTRVHAENETRILSLATDDSREQTARVLLELADESNGDGDMERWRDLQRWLTDAEHRVTIPYARQLAQSVAPVAVRLRRDFGSLLALIRAHAVLHQASRARDVAGCIVATLDDYAAVRDLVADTIAEGVGTTVSDTVRETVVAVGALASKEGVMARDVAEKLGLDKSNVSRRLRMAADGGYLRNLEDKRGKPGRWVIGDSLPESVDLLPDPAQLATASATANSIVDLRGCEDGCAVALEFQGENGEASAVGEGLFAAHNSKVVDERCGCGNALLTPDAINSRKCKPCRDKLMSGYDQ
jgi:hypothetical protein